MSELDLDAIEALRAEWDNPDSRVPLSEITRGAVNALPALIARCREEEAYAEQLEGHLNDIISTCWRTGIMRDPELDQSVNDYPKRVIREQMARIRELEGNT